MGEMVKTYSSCADSKHVIMMRSSIQHLSQHLRTRQLLPQEMRRLPCTLSVATAMIIASVACRAGNI
jgi:hypothetical protein